MIQEKGMSYKRIFEDHVNQKGKKKEKEKAKGGNTTSTKEVIHSVPLSELKTIIKAQKLSLNNDEVNLIVDSFLDMETINYKIMEDTITNAVNVIESEKNEKENIFTKVSTEIVEAIQSKDTTLQKMFFEFDARSDGTLKLDELNEMMNFLQLRMNKTEIKIVFEEMDFDKKGYITIKEFQSFFDQSQFHKQKKDEVIEDKTALSALEPIIKKMQDAAIQKQTSLERVLQSLTMDFNQIVSIKLFEKVLLKMG